MSKLAWTVRTAHMVNRMTRHLFSIVCIYFQVKVLNDGGEFPANAEVVVSPPAIFVPSVKDTIRPDIKVR